MKVEAIGIGLSRRSMFEATDLGVRMVSAHARSVWRSYLPVHVFAVVVSAAFMEWGAGWSGLALFMLKPWLDRTLLFVLARAAFREDTRFVDVAAAWREVWWRDLLLTFTVRRLSLWRSYVQPAQQLEGQRGPERRRRVRQILQNHRGAAFGMQGAFSTVELVVTFGLFALPAWFGAIDGQHGWFDALFAGDASWIATLQFFCYAIAVAFVEPFFVGAGFAMYLNRRVELEAWDIEQEFRVVFAT